MRHGRANVYKQKDPKRNLQFYLHIFGIALTGRTTTNCDISTNVGNKTSHLLFYFPVVVIVYTSAAPCKMAPRTTRQYFGMPISLLRWTPSP